MKGGKKERKKEIVDERLGQAGVVCSGAKSNCILFYYTF
jgi:hypothetical protein